MHETMAEPVCHCVLIDAAGESSPSDAAISGAIRQRREVKRILVALGGAPAGETKLPFAVYKEFLDAVRAASRLPAVVLEDGAPWTVRYEAVRTFLGL